MKLIACIGILTVSLSAMAYEDGTYECKNSNSNLPANVYKITTIEVGGLSLPTVEVTRHFMGSNGSAQTFVIKGLAVHSKNDSRELIALNNINLEFMDNKIQNCRTQD